MVHVEGRLQKDRHNRNNRHPIAARPPYMGVCQLTNPHIWGWAGLRLVKQTVTETVTTVTLWLHEVARIIAQY